MLEGRVTQEGGISAKLRLEVELKPRWLAFDGAGSVCPTPVVAGQVVDGLLWPGARRAPAGGRG